MADKIVVINGGIGAGKSVVSRILRTLGYEVYDCDSEARRIMDCSPSVRKALIANFGMECVNADGTVNRKALARIVFADAKRLERLNGLVHRLVVDDAARWAAERGGTVFVETALLYQSGLDRIADEVWEVEAPRETRATRAASRDNSTLEEIALRIERQDSYEPARIHPHVCHIVNDGIRALLPQVLDCLSR